MKAARVMYCSSAACCEAYVALSKFEMRVRIRPCYCVRQQARTTASMESPPVSVSFAKIESIFVDLLLNGS